MTYRTDSVEHLQNLGVELEPVDMGLTYLEEIELEEMIMDTFQQSPSPLEEDYVKEEMNNE